MLHPLQHLPLATLALAPLRSLPRDRVVELLGLMDELIRSDERIELFEYCLARLAATKLADVLDPQGRPPFGRARLGERRESALALLSVLAAHGHEGEEAARRAFQAGARIAFGDEPVGYAPPADWIAALDRALPSLDELKPEAKELLLEAMAAIVAHDGRIAVVEAELLRTIAACLHLPIPPLAGGAEAA
ncbi:MAG: hypothetical protein RML12_03105 [Xanthomonadales bacterium]|nr:hypothetical protein [Xanthomonadales bacterium]